LLLLLFELAVTHDEEGNQEATQAAMAFRDEASADRKALYYTPFVVAPISMFSSIYVCYLILRRSRRKDLETRPREQLLLGMSCLDILGSFGLAFSTTPGPAIQENDAVHLPTYGTVQTCTAQDFFVHMGVRRIIHPTVAHHHVFAHYYYYALTASSSSRPFSFCPPRY
jgi:hypothetical protein